GGGESAELGPKSSKIRRSASTARYSDNSPRDGTSDSWYGSVDAASVPSRTSARTATTNAVPLRQSATDMLSEKPHSESTPVISLQRVRTFLRNARILHLRIRHGIGLSQRATSWALSKGAHRLFYRPRH